MKNSFYNETSDPYISIFQSTRPTDNIYFTLIFFFLLISKEKGLNKKIGCNFLVCSSEQKKMLSIYCNCAEKVDVVYYKEGFTY